MFPPPAREAADPLGTSGEVIQGEATQITEVAPIAAPLISAETEETLLLELGTPGTHGHYLAEFTNRGGRLLSLRLGDVYTQGDLTPEEQADPAYYFELLSPNGSSENWQEASFGLVAGPSSSDLFDEPLNDALWQMEELVDQFGVKQGVRFTYGSAKGVVITKELRSRDGERVLDFTIGLENVSAVGASQPRQFRLTPAAVMGAASDGAGMNMYPEPQAISAWIESGGDAQVETEAMVALPGADDLVGAFKATGAFGFAGVQNKFFACLLRPSPSSQNTLVGASWRRVEDLNWAASHLDKPRESWQYIVSDIDIALHLGDVGEKRTWDYEVYAGPKAREDLLAASGEYDALISEDLGFFQGIAHMILAVLDFYMGLVGNWGWAIIFLTLTVRLMLFPINRRSQTAMARYQKKMKRVQPKLDELKTKYADNTQKQREEQARIMQEEGAFPPLGGCLPMFLQIPVFIGLFQSLRVEYNLRQEPFLLWVRDLSLPDHLLRLDLNTHLPFIGTIEYLNVLPLLMVFLWVWQQRSMPTPTDAQQAKMQKMMMWMPVMFGFMLYSYPAGLSLYMITSSAVGIFEIKVIKKFWPVDDTEIAPKKGWMMRIAEKQAEQQASMQKMQQQQQQSKQKARKKRKR